MKTEQKPIGSGFGAVSTTNDVISGINLTGKTAIVTGGYSGLGKETVRTLRLAGAEVIVPTRDYERAEAALKDIDGIKIELMDLLDPSSIDAFADKFLASDRPLHILVNCAAIMACPLYRDSRGYEFQLATNHLWHFQLTTRLLPALRKANGSRVVSVSSWGHHFSPFVFDDPNFENRDYTPWEGYGQSKTANVLFTVELDKRFKKDGIRAFSLHPGSIAGTGLGRYLPEEALLASGSYDEQGNPIIDPSKNLKTIEQGAATIVWCAVSPQLNDMGGVYCENCDVAHMDFNNYENWRIEDATDFSGVMPFAVDNEAAERLWNLSERLISGKQ